MSHINQTRVRKAIRRSWDTSEFEPIDDEWWVRICNNSSFLGIPPMAEKRVTLSNADTGDSIDFAVGGCTSMTEYVDYATECLLRRYHERGVAA